MLSSMENQPEQFTFDFATETAEIIAASRDELKLKIGQFAGPLDLLLYLIKQEQANIFDIPIARIADEYLRYIRLMKSLDIAVAADFLVMAATLIEIKSKMLLPRDPASDETDEFDDPRQELVDRLLEYEKFKSAAGMLYEKATVEQAVFARGRIESDGDNTEVDASVFDLITVFQRVLARQSEEIQLEIHREEISLAEMIRNLRRKLAEAGEIDLAIFLEEMHTRRELVTAFLAVLEIVRTEGIRMVQRKTFGAILLRKA